MFEIFGSNVFVEIGEAIGNVKRKVFRKRADPRAIEQAFQRWLAESDLPSLRSRDSAVAYPDVDVIDGTFRTVTDEEEST